MKFFDYPEFKDLESYKFWVQSGIDLGKFLARKYIEESKKKPEGIEEWWDRSQKDLWEKQLSFVDFWNCHLTDNWQGMDRRNIMLYQKATWEGFLKILMLYNELHCKNFEELDLKFSKFKSTGEL